MVANGAGERQYSHRQQDSPPSNAQRSQRDDFAVRGHAAQTQQHADEHGHRNRKCKYAGENAQKKFQDLAAGAAVPDKQTTSAGQAGVRRKQT